MSTRRRTVMIAVVIRSAFAGVVKKMAATRRLPIVRHVYAKSKKPDPRVCKPGGETKMDTRSNTHQRKEMMRKRMVK
jgi:hypothetical protein